MSFEKDIQWIGSSLKDLLAFSQSVRREAGFQLGKVQAGLPPDDWKPFNEEIRIRDSDGIYRIMYVAKFEEAIYVLHCFEKKTQTTSKNDKEIARVRYRAVVEKRKR